MARPLRALLPWAVLAALAVAGCSDDDEPATAPAEATTTTGTRAPADAPADDGAAPAPDDRGSADDGVTTTTEAGTATTSVAGTAAGVDGVLLRLSDLPAGWTDAPDEYRDVHPEEAFCDQSVPTSGLTESDVAAFGAGDDGPFAVSAGLLFASSAAATRYLDDVAATTECSTWTDDNGWHHVAAPDDRTTAAEETDGYSQLVNIGETTVATDLTYLRQGRQVVILTIVSPEAARVDAGVVQAIVDAQVENLLAG